MGYSSNNSSGKQQNNSSSGSGLGSAIQLLVIFILLAIIAVGGIFGYKYLQDDKSKQDVNIANTNDQPIQREDKPQIKKVQQKTSPIKSATSEQKMYTQDQMQEIVKMMVANIQTKQVKSGNNDEDQNSDLMNSLSDIDVDQINSISTKNTDTTDTTQKVTTNSNDKIDRYNKVVVDNTEGDLDDLANQLNNTIEALDQDSSQESTYTKAITTEVSTRKNEMRVIIVKNGDSLSKIAVRAYGTASAYVTIMEANPDLIKNPNRIYVGQRLRVPLKTN
jgi:nucleoid-associated protein YgaU